MPVYLQQSLENLGVLGLWLMQEPEAWFMQHLDLYPEEQVELASLKGHRRLEWLASRHLLHTLYKGLDRVPCIKDQYGKPYLAGMTDHISFSHSRDLVAAIYSPHAVGIDVQYVVPRITALRPKFVSSQEANLTQNADDVHYLHVVWGAKESMYKAYGRRQLDLREHLQVQWSGNAESLQGSFNGYLQREGLTLYYTIHYRWFADWVLVYALEQPPD